MELDYSKLAKGFPKPIERVYLFLGSDDALKREALRKLTEPLLDPSFADFDREERDIPPTGAGEAGEAARAILASAGGRSDGLRAARRHCHQRAAAGQRRSGSAGGGAAASWATCPAWSWSPGATEYDAGKVKGRSAGDQAARTPSAKPARRCCATRPATAA